MLKIYSPRGIKERTIIHQNLPAMYIKRLFFFLLLGVFGPVLVCGQTLNLISNGNPNGYNFNFQGIPSQPPNPDETPKPVIPFYWIFTLCDNGDYLPLLERKKVQGNGQVWKPCWENYTGFTQSNTLLTYAYPPNPIPSLSFTPRALILYRKGDPPPPPTNTMLVAPPITLGPSSLGVRQATIPTGRSIYLAHSHGYLKDVEQGVSGQMLRYNKSVFVIAYQPECVLSGGSVHLFYGRKRIGPPTSTQFVRSGHFLPNPDPHNPVYIASSAPVFSNPSVDANSNFAYHSKFTLSSSYVTDVRTTIGLKTEQRLFEEVGFDRVGQSSSVNQLKADEWSYVIAVLTSSSSEDSPCSVCPTPYDSILQDLHPYDGYNSAACTLNNERIVGVDTIYLKSGEPIDPNNMAVSQVCQQQYLTLKLKFCNLPPADQAATRSTIEFTILDPNKFEWCSLKSLQYPEGVTHSWNSCQPFSCFGPMSPGEARYNCENHFIEVYDPLQINQCAVAEVVLLLKNPMNLGNYLTTTPILEAKVTLLPNHNVLTVTNSIGHTKIPEVPDCPDIETSCEGHCYTLLDFILAFLALLLGLGGGLWAWGKKKNKGQLSEG